MFNAVSRLLVMLAIGWTGVAHATLMPPVTVNGQQWLQPLDFVNLSGNDIAAVCDHNTGDCNGSLGGNDLTGWTWASVPDLHAVFTAFGIPGFTGSGTLATDQSANSVWAPQFLESFQPTRNLNGVGVQGLLRTNDLFQTAFGGVVDDVHPFFNNTVWDIAIILGSGPYSPDEPSSDTGGWFYRNDVPSPATLPLLSLGLAALGYSRRKRITS